MKAIIVKPFSIFLNEQQRQLGSGPLLLDFSGRIHNSLRYFCKAMTKLCKTFGNKEQTICYLSSKFQTFRLHLSFSEHNI